MKHKLTPAINDLLLAYPTNVSGQAEGFVRNLIGTGRLSEGEKLPSTAALADSWGIPASNAHAALANLVKDGLLVRQPGKGTFVCRRKPELTSVAIYIVGRALANPESNLHRVILSELLRQLAELHLETHVIVDPRDYDGLRTPLPALNQLARTQRVGAIIVTAAHQNMMSWLPRLRHLAVFGENERRPWAQVAIDFPQMADTCLQALAAQGCRTVGLLCGLTAAGKARGRTSSTRADFYKHFANAARNAKLRILDDWIVPVAARNGYRTFQEAGYAAFRELWLRGKTPDGLVIYPDSYMPGIFLAMAELGIRAPTDIRLAYHRNEQTPLFSPFPVTEAILSEKEIAATLIAQAKRAWAGETCTRALVPMRREDKTQLQSCSDGCNLKVKKR